MPAVLWRYAPLLILLAFWEGLASAHLLPPGMLPGVGAVALAFGKMIASGELLVNAGQSLARAAAGLALAVAVGVPAGLCMARIKVARLLLNPIVQALYPMPKSALVPLTIIWFGLGSLSKIVLIFIGCLLPIVMSSYNGARGVNPFLVWSAESFGASRRAVILDVVLPAATPDILAGIRTALAFAFILMVTSEFIIAKDGIGYLISLLGDGGAYPSMFAAIFTVALAGFIIDRAFGAYVGWQLRWKRG